MGQVADKVPMTSLPNHRVSDAACQYTKAHGPLSELKTSRMLPAASACRSARLSFAPGTTSSPSNTSPALHAMRAKNHIAQDLLATPTVRPTSLHAQRSLFATTEACWQRHMLLKAAMQLRASHNAPGESHVVAAALKACAVKQK